MSDAVLSDPVQTPVRNAHARRRADLAVLSLKWLYGALFALSLIAINPWGGDRGEIWVQPKVDVIAILTLLNLGFLVMSRLGAVNLQGPARTGRSLTGAAALWGLFLFSGLVTMLRSPAPASSLRAHLEMGDGYLYWLLVGAFVLSNALVLRVNPRLFRIQLIGVVVGGFILACAMFPQALDWRIDYTDTSGQVSSNPRMLVSSMWITQMPIGFHTSRGHAGFVVAAAAVLALVGLLRGWLKPLYVWPGYFVLTLAVWFTTTRSIFLAFAVGLLWVLARFWHAPSRRALLWAFLVPLLSFGAYQGASSLFTVETRSVPALLPSTGTDLNTFLSLRPRLWEPALEAVPMRPLFGWGFDGFGISWPYVADWSQYGYKLPSGVPVERVLAPSNYGFRYLGTDGAEHQGNIYTNKAHNIFLDTALSVGLVGLLIYSALFLFFFVVSARGSGWGLEAVAVVYFVFVLAWFESAQYSHLAWWALSAGLGLALAQRVAPRRETERGGTGPRSAVAAGD